MSYFPVNCALKKYLPQNEDTGLDRLIIYNFFYYWYGQN